METDFQIAVAHQMAGRLEEAEGLYRQLIHWRPSWVLGNLGMIYRATGRLEESEVALREALRHEPDNIANQHTLGMTLLQARKYVEGWAYYEARHRMYPRATRDFCEWRGEPLKGRRILVLGEQGFGDQILWARFLPLLAEGASEVLLAVNSALGRLFEALPVRLVRGDQWENVEADFWCSLGSVPRWLEVGPADAPSVYLSALRASHSGGKTGLMLEGGAGNPNMNRIPPAAIGRAIRGLAPFVDLEPAATGAHDFADTATIVRGLRRVVSVDTSVAHLAGALGTPCLTLLPRPAMDWFSSWVDDQTPWYPSMRTIRQRSAGDWAGVLAGLAQHLESGA